LALVGALIFSFGLCSLVARNPAFHKWLHQDSTQDNHQCPVRLLEKQQVLASDPILTLGIFDCGLTCPICPCHTFLATSADVRLSDSRAPPVS